MPHVARFTDRFLQSLKNNPPKDREPIWSQAVPGLCVRAGKRKIMFAVRAGSGGLHTIGEWPQWTPLEAERRAREIKAEVKNGPPPKPDALPSMREAWASYESVRLQQCRAATRKEYRRQMETRVFPEFGDKPVDKFKRADMAKLFIEITKSGRRYRANRVTGTVRAFFNWMRSAEIFKGENPAGDIDANAETNREIYLNKDQLESVFAALDRYPGGEGLADCIRFLAMTGCRSAEARNARWDQFDSELSIWEKPASATKQRKMHRVPLTNAASDLLARRLAMRGKDDAFVFGEKPIKEIRGVWDYVRRETGLAHVRAHDLRHSFASLAVSAGIPLITVGGLLGHSAVATTQKYSHLFLDDLKSAAAKVHARLPGNGNGGK